MDLIDWNRNKVLLLEDSKPIVRALFIEIKGRGDILSAIGYVFEFGRGQLCFELCANTERNATESRAVELANSSNAFTDDFRWNSGNYDYPGGVQDKFGDWSSAWWDEMSRLDRLATDECLSKNVHDGIADICCEVLAELAKDGILGDWAGIDFNVATLLDDIELVKKRNAHIRDRIRLSTKSSLP